MNRLFIIILAIAVVYFLFYQKPSPVGVSEFGHCVPKQKYNELIEELGEPYFIVNKPGGLVLWSKPDFFQEIILRDESIEHSHPTKHCDFIYITVKVYIPDDTIDVIETISDSIVYDRLKKELTARCNSLETIVATLQLAMEVTYNPLLADTLKEEYTARILACKEKGNYNRMKKSLEIMVKNNQSTYHNIFPNINCTQSKNL